jgi:hypothetical protein
MFIISVLTNLYSVFVRKNELGLETGSGGAHASSKKVFFT